MRFDPAALHKYLPSVLAAVAILIVGYVVAGWVASLIRRGSERTGRISPTLVAPLSKTARLAVLIVMLMAALDQVGVDTTSFLALLGALGLGVGLALKDTIADVAAGVALLILRPFDVGEAIDTGGTLGTVVSVGLFQTEMLTFDGVPVTLSNTAVRNSTISNFSRAEKRRIDLTIGIGYADDIAKAKAALEDVLAKESRILSDPPTLVNVIELGDSSVNLLVRGWTQPADFFDTKLDLTRAIKERLDAEHINIPFPQRDIHVIKGDAA
jgi:small conductance mechanosensitive channel